MNFRIPNLKLTLQRVLKLPFFLVPLAIYWPSFSWIKHFFNFLTWYKGKTCMGYPLTSELGDSWRHELDLVTLHKSRNLATSHVTLVVTPFIASWHKGLLMHKSQFHSGYERLNSRGVRNFPSPEQTYNYLENLTNRGLRRQEKKFQKFLFS